MECKNALVIFRLLYFNVCFLDRQSTRIISAEVPFYKALLDKRHSWYKTCIILHGCSVCFFLRQLFQRSAHIYHVPELFL